MKLDELKNKHKGADIWVVAAGPSLNFIAPSFFHNKTVIGVNQAYKWFRADYIVRKEYQGMEEAREWADAHGALLIASRYNCGTLKAAQNQGAHIFFDHSENGLERIDLSAVGSADRIVVSYSTITSAIHIAAYMGAANILLVGHDCGTLDDQSAYRHYRDNLENWQFRDDAYRRWLGVIEPQTIALREKLREVYGCEVYSLNPFVNFGLEGHHYVHS